MEAGHSGIHAGGIHGGIQQKSSSWGGALRQVARTHHSAGTQGAVRSQVRTECSITGQPLVLDSRLTNGLTT